MDIQGLDYNTQRERLLMPEYGREIQKMVDMAVSLPTREERQQCAATIVKLMESRVPQIRENEHYEHTLWDHLYLMSGKQLDIDWPYDMAETERMQTKPQPVPLPKDSIRQRHYGRLVEELLEKLKTMPASDARDELVRLTANQMKRDLMQWGHGSIDDERVASDLARFTDGNIQLDLHHFVFDKMALGGDDLPVKGKKRKK